MEDILKPLVLCLIGILIFCCARRQRRYWRELSDSKPTGSLRAGYSLAVATVFIALAVTLFINTESAWQVFISLLLLTVAFCVKITFSPAMIGLTLAICAARFYTDDDFPVLAVWASFTSILTWRLPEEFRIAYSCVTFIWVMVVMLTFGSTTEGDVPTIDDVMDATSSLQM